jgi:hypothetical protein
VVIVVVFVSIVVGLGFVLLLRIQREIAGMPARVWSIAKQERAKDDSQALAVLQEAAAGKVIAITAALRLYEEELAATSRAQIADAEKRARIAERRLSEAGAPMEAATQLVRELRTALDELRAPRAAPTDEAASAAPAERDQRPTVEMPKPPASCAPRPDDAAEEDEDTEEMTKVAARPDLATLAAANGFRPAPRPAIPPPPGEQPASRKEIA